MQLAQKIKVYDKENELQFEIDFQETPHDYRIKRINQMLKKYPRNDFKWRMS